jgi:hypothetical protein
MSVKKIDVGGNSLNIKEFLLSSIGLNSTIVMIAKRGSGKSVVCRALLKHFKNIPVGLVISPTNKMNQFYGDFVPESYIHYEYKSSILEKVLARQSEINTKNEEKQSLGLRTKDPRAFIVMDDCLAAKGTWANDPQIKELFFNGRHYFLTYILTMQFPLGISPELRSNFDYIFLLADDMHSNIKRMHDHYAGMFPKLVMFQQTFEQLTKDHGCMVIANKGARATFYDKIFWFKAPDPKNDEPFQVGNEQYKNFHKSNYDPGWKKKKNSYNLDNVFKTKKID